MTMNASVGESSVQRTASQSDTAVEVEPQTAAGWIRSGRAVLVDVRERDEHAAERIEGSTLVPLSRFATGSIRLMPGQAVVFHCRSGKRSRDACRLASELRGQHVEIASLRGGIEGWKSVGLPVVTAQGRPRRGWLSSLSVVRQVQLTIGLGTLAGSALAWLVHPGFIAIPAFFGLGLTFAGASGTCGLASLLSVMPWNRFVTAPETCGAKTGQ